MKCFDIPVADLAVYKCSSVKYSIGIVSVLMQESLQERTSRLRAAVKLLAESTEEIIQAWESEHKPYPVDIHFGADVTSQPSTGSTVPSHELYEARRRSLGAMGVVTELVHDPRMRLAEMTMEFYESRAFHIVAEARVADLLDERDKQKGVHISELSKLTGVKEQKLARILRTLCTVHVFREVSDGYFANNDTSATLVNDEPFRAFLLLNSQEVYEASAKLPEVIFDPLKTNSESVLVTPFQVATGKNLSLWDWMEQPEVLEDGTLAPKPLLDRFMLAMVGAGRAQGPPLYEDYPWSQLGNGTIVDVGGGVGGMCIDLAKRYPQLKFIVQDREGVITNAPSIWQRDFPQALEEKRVVFRQHDFFTEQPVKNAEVYNLRYIMHDWSDEECIRILSSLRPALGPNSRILICDQVMNKTYQPNTDSGSFNAEGSNVPHGTLAPYPLLANYGIAHRFKHFRDLNMLTTINGRERTAEEFESLAKKSGLEVVKVWECRGIVWITELRFCKI
ncbi:S-adenosyl-L-methionine-dependent methyltransferase [Abortiporus biennis]|nr:S-adenosyl-L-methionine-dependent methyltransferase [Abortiporus biennis]